MSFLLIKLKFKLNLKINLNNTYKILETIATSNQFQAKNVNSTDTTKWPNLSGRKVNVWYNLEYYLNTDRRYAYRRRYREV